MPSRTWLETARLCTMARPRLQEFATPAALCEHKRLSRRLHQRAKPKALQSSTPAKPRVTGRPTKPERERTTDPLPQPREFIYVAIDGDACPFHQDLIVRGRKGGYTAVELLLKEIKHLFDLASDDLTDVIVQIFLNQKGHTSYTWHVYRIHTEVSAAFYEGLNQADPLLNVVNVGSQKEAADLKIRAGLNFHIRLPGCRKVALAGLADGGYAGFLRSFISRGQRNKVVLLKTSENIAAGIAKGLGYDPDDKYGLVVAPLPSDLFQPEPIPSPSL